MDSLFSPSRLAALAETGLLHTAPEEEFDRLTKVARHALELDAVVLNLLDDVQQFCKSACDPDDRLRAGDTVPVSDTLCERVIRAGRPLVIHDLRQAPWSLGLPTVTCGKIAAYLGVPLRSEGGEIIGVLCALARSPRIWVESDVALLQDIANAIATEIRLRRELRIRTATERVLGERERRLRTIFEASALGIAILDDVGRFAEVNPALTRMLGYSADELTERTLVNVTSPEDYPRERPRILDLLRGRCDSIRSEMRYLRKDGTTIWGRLTASIVDPTSDGRVQAVGLWEDTTERKAMEHSLREQALTDELTGLSNRRGFLHLAEQQLKLARHKNREIVLLFMDLDGFKQINDTHGHAAGDQALRELASVLRRWYRDSDLLARIGGDEFVVMAVEADCDDPSLTRRLEDAVRRLNEEQRLPFPLRLSIGVVRADPHSERTLATLLQKADQQMYEAKRARKADMRLERPSPVQESAST